MGPLSHSKCPISFSTQSETCELQEYTNFPHKGIHTLHVLRVLLLHMKNATTLSNDLSCAPKKDLSLEYRSFRKRSLHKYIHSELKWRVEKRIVTKGLQTAYRVGLGKMDSETFPRRLW